MNLTDAERGLISCIKDFQEKTGIAFGLGKKNKGGLVLLSTADDNLDVMAHWKKENPGCKVEIENLYPYEGERLKRMKTQKGISTFYPSGATNVSTFAKYLELF